MSVQSSAHLLWAAAELPLELLQRVRGGRLRGHVRAALHLHAQVAGVADVLPPGPTLVAAIVWGTGG